MLDAIFSLAISGIFSVFLGIMLHIAVWWLSSNSVVPLLKRICFVCFVLFLPLMILGAHFLDLIEKVQFNV
jgi:hypothetical protein